MTRLLSIGAAILCAAAALHAQTNAYTPVVATHIKYGGTDIANGYATFTLVNGANAVPFNTADGTLNGPEGFPVTITNGAIASTNVPDMCTARAAVPNGQLGYLVQVSQDHRHGRRQRRHHQHHRGLLHQHPRRQQHRLRQHALCAGQPEPAADRHRRRHRPGLRRHRAH